MTFVAGFYSFNLEITNSTPPLYSAVRVKCGRHPRESMEYLVARVLALAHSFEEGLTFSRGLFEIKEPAIWRRGLLGDVTHWIEVGLPERERFVKALKAHSEATVKAYFLNEEEISHFCTYLRGSKQNWVAAVKFFLLPEALLTNVAEVVATSNRWTLTFADDHLYLSAGERDFEGVIEEVDIWQRFQRSIDNEGGKS